MMKRVIGDPSNDSNHIGKSYSEILRIICDNVSLFSDSEMDRFVVPFLVSRPKKMSSLIERFCFLVDFINAHRHFPIIIQNLLIPMLKSNEFFTNCMMECIESSKNNSKNIERETFVRVLSGLNEKISNLYFDSSKKVEPQEKKATLMMDLLDASDSMFKEEGKDTKSLYTSTNSSLWKQPTFFHSDNYVPLLLKMICDSRNVEEGFRTIVLCDLIVQFCKRGYTGNICSVLVEWYFEPDSMTLTVLSSLDASSSILESIIKGFIQKLVTGLSMKQYEEVVNFFATRISESIAWYDYFTNGFIFKYSFAERVVNRNEYIFVKLMVDSMVSSTKKSTTIALSSVTDFISSTWKQHFFIAQSNVEQQLCR